MAFTFAVKKGVDKIVNDEIANEDPKEAKKIADEKKKEAEKKEWEKLKSEGDEDAIASHFAKLSGMDEDLDEEMAKAGAPPPDKKGFAGISLYTCHGDWRMNGLLRNGSDPKGEDEKVKMMTKSTVHGLSQLPNHEGVVYRGMQLDPGIADKYQEGLVIQEKGFSSTSQNQNVAEEFAYKVDGKESVVMIIKSKTGKDISHLSRLKKEGEVLLAPDTKFHVKKRRNEGRKIYIELEEVD